MKYFVLIGMMILGLACEVPPEGDGATPSPTPAVSPTPAPGDDATPAPQPTPSPMPDGSPAPSPSPTASPSPSPVASPSPSPMPSPLPPGGGGGGGGGPSGGGDDGTAGGDLFCEEGFTLVAVPAACGLDSTGQGCCPVTLPYVSRECLCVPDDANPPPPTPTPTPPPFACDPGEVVVVVPANCAEELEIQDGYGCCPEDLGWVSADICACVSPPSPE